MADRVRINEWKAFTFLNQFDLKEIKSFFRSFEIITTRKAHIRMPFFSLLELVNTNSQWQIVIRSDFQSINSIDILVS